MKMHEDNANDQIQVGISACLVGQKVRFDAGHKRDRYITDILGRFIQFVAVCPELEVGMGVPREAVRLEGSTESPGMVGNKTGKDWTDRMNAYAEKRVRRGDLQNLSGYILKKDSPSCGMERVRVYAPSGMPTRAGVGLYAAHLKRRFPLLPIEEERRLNDPEIRENFIERIFAYYALRKLFADRFSRGRVVEFHAAAKYLLLSHSPRHYKRLDALVAAIMSYSPAAFRDEYSRLFMEALAVKTTARKNVNVLQHILGFLKNDLPSDDKRYVIDVIEDYRNGLAPLIAPITLVRHFIRKYNIEFIADQSYLNPHPKHLMLRNHA